MSSRPALRPQLLSIDTDIYQLESEIEQAISSGKIPPDLILPTPYELEQRCGDPDWHTGEEFIKTGSDVKRHLVANPGFNPETITKYGLNRYYNIMVRLEALRKQRSGIVRTALNGVDLRAEFVDPLESILFHYSQTLQEKHRELCLLYGTADAPASLYRLVRNRDGIKLETGGYNVELATLLNQYHFLRGQVLQVLDLDLVRDQALRLLEVVAEISQALARTQPNYDEELRGWVGGSPLWLIVADRALKPTLSGMLPEETGTLLEGLRLTVVQLLSTSGGPDAGHTQKSAESQVSTPKENATAKEKTAAAKEKTAAAQTTKIESEITARPPADHAIKRNPTFRGGVTRYIHEKMKVNKSWKLTRRKADDIARALRMSLSTQLEVDRHWNNCQQARTRVRQALFTQKPS